MQDRIDWIEQRIAQLEQEIGERDEELEALDQEILTLYDEMRNEVVDRATRDTFNIHEDGDDEWYPGEIHHR